MFNPDRPKQNTALESVISNLIGTLTDLTKQSNDKDYSTATDNLVKLVKAQNDTRQLDAKITYDSEAQLNENVKLNLERDKLNLDIEKLALDREKLQFEKDKSNSWVPSPEAVLGVVGTIATVVLVLHFERAGVITSKALAFVGKSMR